MVSIIPYEKMAKLDLPTNERELLQKSVNSLIESFDKLEDIDTNGVEPLFTVLPLTNVLREDFAKKIFSRDVLLKTAPESYEGYFQVPKTIE